MEALEKLKQRLIVDMRNSEDADRPYVSSNNGSWTKNQIADELERGTLTLDLMSKGRTKINEIKWSASVMYTFGTIGGLTLFYIKNRQIGGGLERYGGLDRYELEVKFLDQRWTSNNEDELKLEAEKQVHNLIEKLAG